MNNINSINKVMNLISSFSRKKNILVVSYTSSASQVFSINVVQKTYSSSLYLENESFCETISSSKFVSLAKRIYQNEKEIKVYEAKELNELKDKETPSIYDINAYFSKYKTLIKPYFYIDEYGKYSKQETNTIRENLLPIIIDENTILSITEKENKYIISLSPKKANLYYSELIKENGDFDELPVFNNTSIEITYKDDILTSTRIHNEYKAKSGFLKLNITENTYSEYKYNVNKNIPAIKDEFIKYNDNIMN